MKVGSGLQTRLMAELSLAAPEMRKARVPTVPSLSCISLVGARACGGEGHFPDANDREPRMG
jgi:hypothetical protein